MQCRATKCSPTQYAPLSTCSILCTLNTQYAPLEHFVYPAYTIFYQRSILCRVGTYVISVVVRGYTICSSWKHVSWYVCLFSNCPLDIHLSILRTLCLQPCPHHNCFIEVFNPHQQNFGDVVSKFSFLTDMKPTFGNIVRKNGETPGFKCRKVMNLYESTTTWTFINAIGLPVPLEYIWLPL